MKLYLQLSLIESYSISYHQHRSSAKESGLGGAFPFLSALELTLWLFESLDLPKTRFISPLKKVASTSLRYCSTSQKSLET